MGVAQTSPASLSTRLPDPPGAVSFAASGASNVYGQTAIRASAFAQPKPGAKTAGDQTPAERKLWRAIRSRLPIEGTHFRRQVSLGPYIADFCSLGAKLIVEVDGHQHGEEKARARDAARDRYLSQNGFLVLRFSNRDVMTNMDVVLDTIFHALMGTASPQK